MMADWIVRTWLPIFLNLWLQSAIVLMLGGAIVLLLRRGTAARCHAAAAATLIGLLLLPAVGLLPTPRKVTPFGRQLVGRAPSAAARPAIASGANTADSRPARPEGPLTARSNAAADSHAGADEPSGARRSSVAASGATPLHRSAAPEAGISQPSPPFRRIAGPVNRVVVARAAAALFAIWLGACLLLLVRLASACGRLAALAGRTRLVADDRLRSMVADSASEFGCRRVRVLQGVAVGGGAVPVTWGAWRTVILLPDDAAAWPEARLRAVLLHELAHIRRGDWWVHTAAEIACALFWFQPVAWLLLRRMQIDVERACDDAVLALGVSQSDYARHLLEVARMVRQGAIPASAIAIVRGSQLGGRVESILGAQGRRTPAGLRGLVAACAVAAPLIVGIAWLRPIVPAAMAQSTKTFVTRRGGPMSIGLQRAIVESAVVPVSGPGVEITLQDSRPRRQGIDPARAIIHDTDITGLVNVLRVAGAEAVAVGGERFDATTVARATGTGVAVNGSVEAAPFLIRAIGDPDRLLRAINIAAGPLQAIRLVDPTMVRAVKSSRVELPGRMRRSAGARWAVSAPSAGVADPYWAVRGYAGMCEVHGAGITVALSDSTHPPAGGRADTAGIFERDIVAVVDELKLAGAEAIAIGGQRVIASTGVGVAGSHVLVNGVQVEAPLLVRAIGDPDRLTSAMDRPNAAIDRMRRADPAMARVERSADLILPAFQGAEPRFVLPLILPLAAQAPDHGPPGRIVTLDESTGVELVGVSASPFGDGEDCWSADGTPLVGPPVPSVNRFHKSMGGFGSQYLRRTLFFRLRGGTAVQASTTGELVDRDGRLQTDGLHYGHDLRVNDTQLLPDRPATGVVPLAFPPSTRSCTYRFGIATGPWETAAVTRFSAPPPRGGRHPDEASISMGAAPQLDFRDTDGRYRSLPLLGTHAPLGDVARRIVLVDSHGDEISLDDGGADYHGDQRYRIGTSDFARAAEFRLEVRPYRWAEFPNIALNPTRGPEPRTIASPRPLPMFSHKFTNGLKVSVLGVTERKADGGRWWLPDGSPLAGPVRDWTSAVSLRGPWPKGRPRALIIKESSDRDLNFSMAWQYLPDTPLWRGAMDVGISGTLKNDTSLSCCNVVYPPGIRATTLRMGVAAGPWRTVGTVAMPRGIRHKAGGPDSYEGDLSLAVTATPTLSYESAEGRVHNVPMLPAGATIGTAASRLVAIDGAGKTHTLNVTMTGTKRFDGPLTSVSYIELTFRDVGVLRRYNDLDLTTVKEFRLQTRPYEWADFRNIQLDPNR